MDEGVVLLVLMGFGLLIVPTVLAIIALVRAHNAHLRISRLYPDVPVRRLEILEERVRGIEKALRELAGRLATSAPPVIHAAPETRATEGTTFVPGPAPQLHVLLIEVRPAERHRPGLHDAPERLIARAVRPRPGADAFDDRARSPARRPAGRT